MLGLLSKPQAAAQLLSSEGHPQASTSTAAPTLPCNGDTAGDCQGPDLQAAPAQADGPVTGPVEAPKNDSWTSGKLAQPVLAELKSTVNQEAASDAAAREAGPPEYQHSAWQSLPQAGSSSIPVPVQLPASDPELGKDTQADTQAPAEQAREPSQGPGHFAEGHLHSDGRQPAGAGVLAVTTIEQAPAELHIGLNSTSGAAANQQLLLQTACTPDQLGTAAGKQLAAAGTAQAGGSTLGKGTKYKGGGKGAKTQKLGGQLTGSAAHALAVLQAGPPSRSVRGEEEAGACMPLIRRYLFFQQVKCPVLCGLEHSRFCRSACLAEQQAARGPRCPECCFILAVVCQQQRALLHYEICSMHGAQPTPFVGGFVCCRLFCYC